MEKSHKKKHGKKKGFKNGKNPSPNSLSFSGPIISRADKEEADTITTLVTFTGILQSTAGGAIDTNISDDPSSYAVSDWTNLSSAWYEVRSLGLRVEFFPNNRYSKVSVSCTPMICLIDRQSSGTLGSYQAAMDHSSAKKVSLEDPWFEEAKMQNAEEASFQSVSATAARRWIKVSRWFVGIFDLWTSLCL